MPSVMPNADGCSPRMVAPPPPARGTRLTDRVTVGQNRWYEHALCLGQGRTSDSIWHSPWDYPAEEVRKKQLLCMSCPVLEQCSAEPKLAPGLTSGFVWVFDARGRLTAQNDRLCKWCRKGFFGKTLKSRCCSASCRAKLAKYEGKASEEQERLRDVANEGNA